MSLKINRRHFLAAAGVTAFTSGAPWAFAQSDTSTWARVQRTKTVRVGVVRSGIPYYAKDISSGDWSGCMYEFYQGIAASVGAKLELTETTWGNSVLDLQSNKIDLFFGLNPTPQRAAVIDFTDPVLNIAFTLLTKTPEKFPTWASLDAPEFTVAVDNGSSHDALATRLLKQAKIIRLETVTDATLAVQTGRADAQVIVLPLALSIISKNPAAGKMVIPTPQEQATSNGGVRKEADGQWRQHVNDWIRQGHANGQIKSAFFSSLQRLGGVQASAIPKDLTI